MTQLVGKHRFDLEAGNQGTGYHWRGAYLLRRYLFILGNLTGIPEAAVVPCVVRCYICHRLCGRDADSRHGWKHLPAIGVHSAGFFDPLHSAEGQTLLWGDVPHEHHDLFYPFNGVGGILHPCLRHENRGASAF